MSITSYILFLLLIPVVSVAVAQEEIEERSSSSKRDVLAIAGDNGAGVFIADERDGLSYQSASSIPDRPRKLRAVGKRIEGFAPRGMAYEAPYLYVYDSKSRHVVKYNPREPKGERKRLDGAFDRPSHLAVSPQGVVAVLEHGQLSFHQENAPPTGYEKRRFPDASGLAFTTWTTLLVMSKEEVVTINVTRQKDGTVRFLAESSERVEAPDDLKWEAMDVQDGILHLATKRQIYARIEGELIPVLAQSVKLDGIDDFAMVRNGVYILDDEKLYLVARALPVDFIIEGTARNGQEALLAFYTYLAKHDLFRVRSVAVRSGAMPQSVEGIWFGEGALISSQTSHGSISQFASRIAGRKYPVQEVVSVPDFRVDRASSRQHVVLTTSLEQYLNENLPSKELREQVDAKRVKALNPSLAELSDEEIWGLERGSSVVVPSEVWTVTAAVPASDYRNRSSELWKIVDGFENTTMVSREAFVEQSANSFYLQDEILSGSGVADPCESLRVQRRALWEHISYPLGLAADGSQGTSWWVDRQVRVGLLEHRNTVLQNHYAFAQSPLRPVWMEITPAGLEGVAVAQSTAMASQLSIEKTPFSVNSHHGTHVGALIAGQPGPCWSGLLPQGQLVLVDLGQDRGLLYRKVREVLNQDVRVFNVSHTWPGGQNSLYETVKAEPQALWVVAVGNEGLDFNKVDPAEVPAMSRWSDRSNVVSVTASDWTGNVLNSANDESPSSANYGRYRVDLIAPGRGLLSATEPDGFAKASGTSQAAPMVTAAAALLVDPVRGKLTPGDAKARLIATARWAPAYYDRVWGGRLDFGAAVRFPDNHVLYTTLSAANGVAHVITPSNNPRFRITNPARYYERDGNDRAPPTTISWSQILSLRLLSSGQHRLVFRDADDGSLRIVLSANLVEDGADRLQCLEYKRVTGTAEQTEDDLDQCSGGISVASVHTYFRGGAYNIEWGVER